MIEQEHKEILHQLRKDYWQGAFADLRNSGVGKDGRYHPPTDRDWVLMWCTV